MKSIEQEYGELIRASLASAVRPAEQERILSCACSTKRSHKLQRFFNYSNVKDFFALERASLQIPNYKNDQLFLHFGSAWGLWT